MIKSYQKFLESSSYGEIAAICKRYKIKNWSLNPDGLVDVDGNVDLESKGLTKIPLKFGKVSGNFGCSENRLTSLEGSPEVVGCNFWCYKNILTSLEGCPSQVGDSFDCSDNKLKSLEGCPTKLNKSFWCFNNNLTTLEGCPQYVGEIFHCGNNKLISLNGLVYTSSFQAKDNPVSNLSTLGTFMIGQKRSFLEIVILDIIHIPENEIKLIMDNIKPQEILDLNDFKVFNLLRTHLPEKWAEVMSLRDVDLSADLGELGF